ncbi:MAG: fumarylacetoacetase [Marinovum sp.]|nr:fumarylacetoacetase [Marinovum sp.]
MKSWMGEDLGADGFGLANVPYGVFSVGDGDLRCGTRVGDRVIDLTGLEAVGVLRPDADADVLDAPYWNDFMELGPVVWSGYRAALQHLLSDGASEDTQDAVIAHSVPVNEATLHMPFRVSEFTDFYASRHHATNVGAMFRGPENALPPNWQHMPIGYNGRASSVVVSGTSIVRPHGQLKGPSDEMPRWAPSERFDFELELGAIVGTTTDAPLSVAEADEAIFGYVMLNDWSARDIQTWEYQPLGPFQAKATATTISPWIVTAEALRPCRVAGPERRVDLLPYLQEPGPMLFDIDLDVGLTPQDGAETTITRTNYSEMYYSSAQQLAHHTGCGCPMRSGDLLGSGTISGATKDSRGALLELSWGGKEPITLNDGSQRNFLEDGDTVTLRGFAKGAAELISFGECTGQLRPAR